MKQKQQERAFVFEADMVRALLRGQKTQMRLPLKPQPSETWMQGVPLFYNGPPFRKTWSTVRDHWRDYYMHWIHDGELHYRKVLWVKHPDNMTEIKCPVGGPKDRLWVQETHGFEQMYHPMRPPPKKRLCINYKATPTEKCMGRVIDEPPGLDWDRPGWRSHQGGVGLQTMYLSATQLPRWASRILLEIKEVRVEKLTDISEEEAKAEGVTPYKHDEGEATTRIHFNAAGQIVEAGSSEATQSVEWGPYKLRFYDWWKAKYGEDAWRKDPWCWVIHFRMVQDERVDP